MVNLDVLGKNWKTYAGALIIAMSAGLEFLGMAGISSLMMNLGIALGILGIGHKLQRAEKEVL